MRVHDASEYAGMANMVIILFDDVFKNFTIERAG